jgi:hypothetical protein
MELFEAVWSSDLLVLRGPSCAVAGFETCLHPGKFRQAKAISRKFTLQSGVISFRKSQTQLILDKDFNCIKGVFSDHLWGSFKAFLLGKPRIPLYVAFPKIYDISTKYHQCAKD